MSEKDKLYFVPYSEENKSNVFAFKQDGEWHLIGRYNLLKPIKFEHLEEKGDLLLITDKRKSYHGFKENIGIIEYPLPDSPFIKGEKVLIDKNYEYKVDLEGVSYYAVATQNICGWL